jgi:hypothetical protein
MNMRIFKWEIEVTDKQTLMMPAGAKLLDVQIQNAKCCIWALCDQNAEKEPRHLEIYGTGNPIPDDPGKYIATFQMHGGSLVFHAFESCG